MNRTLRVLREQNNYSQAAVASYLGISRQMYIKYENGDVEPPVKIVTELANFYRVPYDIIIEDKLNIQEKITTAQPRHVEYKIAENDVFFQASEPAVVYGTAAPAMDSYTESETKSQKNNSETESSYYLKTILDMLPKLIYKEQLQVLEKISGMVQKNTEEKLKPNKEMHSFKKLTEYADSLHLTSNERGWSREEIYDREICKNR